MSEELFNPKEITSNSPRIRWLKKHDLHTEEMLQCFDDDEWEPWACWSKDVRKALEEDNFGYGKTEHDAITDWCLKNGERLWNEERLWCAACGQWGDHQSGTCPTIEHKK